MHFKLQSPTIVVGAEGPEVLFMDPLHTLQLHHPLIAVSQLVVKLLGRSLHQDGHRVGEHRPDRHPDQDGDKDGADGVSNHPAESPHQDGRNNHPRAAQRVRQDVKKHALHDLTPSFSFTAMTVTMVMAVTVVSTSMTVSVCPTMLEDEDPDQIHLSDYCGNQTSHEARAVKEHVKTLKK